MRIDNKVLGLVLAATLAIGPSACQRQEKQPTTGGDAALWMRSDPSGALIDQGAGARQSVRYGRGILRVRA